MSSYSITAAGSGEPTFADLTDCRQSLQQLQQQQKHLTEALSEQGNLGQSLIDAIV